MNGACFRVLREYLGLPVAWVSGRLDVAERSIARWDNGVMPIPDRVSAALEELADLTQSAVDAWCEEFTAVPPAERVLMTYRTDADYRAAHPDAEFPASWHRAVVARVHDAVGDCEVQFWSPPLLVPQDAA